MHSTKVVWTDGSKQGEIIVLHVVRRYVYLVTSISFPDHSFQGVSNDASPTTEPIASSSTTTPESAAS